jgi:hypothetical protein
LGELLNVGLISHYSFIQMLYTVFKFAEKSTGRQKEFALFLGLHTLPFVTTGFIAKLGLEFRNLLEMVGAILKKRSLDYMKYTRIFRGENPEGIKEVDMLTALYDCVMATAGEQELKSDVLIRFHQNYSKDFSMLPEINCSHSFDLEKVIGNSITG